MLCLGTVHKCEEKIMPHIITLVFTIITAILILWQLAAKKGTWTHALRWAFIAALSGAVVIINTNNAVSTPGCNIEKK